MRHVKSKKYADPDKVRLNAVAIAIDAYMQNIATDKMQVSFKTIRTAVPTANKLTDSEIALCLRMFNYDYT